MNTLKLLAESTLLLAWIGAYLGALYWAGMHRKTRAHALVLPGYRYRVERDRGFWMLAFVVGSVLGLLVCLGSWEINRLF